MTTAKKSKILNSKTSINRKQHFSK